MLYLCAKFVAQILRNTKRYRGLCKFKAKVSFNKVRLAVPKPSLSNASFSAKDAGFSLKCFSFSVSFSKVGQMLPFPNFSFRLLPKVGQMQLYRLTFGFLPATDFCRNISDKIFIK